MEWKKMLGMSNTKSVSQMFVHPDFTIGVIHISMNLLRGYTKSVRILVLYRSKS
jgi:hypothetical protein